MPIGAGFAPAGSTAAGYGVPDAAHVPLNAIFPDALTGLPQTGRYLNPQTGSYQLTADGRTLGWPTVRQLVTLALRTVRRSSAVLNLGQTFTLIQEQGANYPALVAAKVNEALADLIRRGLVQVLSILVQQYPSSPDAGIALVKWRDLTTGVQDQSWIGP